MKKLLFILSFLISLSGFGQNIKTNNFYFFNPKDYGAVGDSLTDDVAAFQRVITAIAATPTKRAHVFVPPGIYRFASTLVIPQSVKITWEGSGSSSDTVITNSTIVPSTYGITKIYVNSTTIDAIRDSSFGALWSYMDIDNIASSNSTAGAGINSLGNMFSAEHMSFHRFFYGIEQQYATNWYINHIAFRDNVQYGIYNRNLWNSDIGDGTISNCQFSSVWTHTVAQIFNLGSGGVRISDCKFNGAILYITDCIKFSVTGSGTSSSDICIVNCSMEQFTGFGVSITVSGGGSFGHVSIIGGNISSYEGGSGINLVNTASTLNHITIGSVALDNNATGIIATSVDDLHISNVANNSTTPMTLVSCTNVFYDRNPVTSTLDGLAPTALYSAFNVSQSVPTLGSVVVQDDFNRANAADINGSTPSPTAIGNWSNIFSSAFVALGITSNALVQPSTGTSGIKTQSSLSSLDVSVVLTTATITGSGDISLVSNCTDAANYVFFQVTSAGAVNLYQKVSNAFTAIYTTTGLSLSNGDTLHLRISGSTAYAIKNSTLIGSGSFSSGSLTGQFAGVLMTGNTATVMDHFTVTTVTAPTSGWQVSRNTDFTGLGTGASPLALSNAPITGHTTLVSGTKTITATGATASSTITANVIGPSGGSLTVMLQGTCTTNSCTIQANIAAGTINSSDNSTVQYTIFIH